MPFCRLGKWAVLSQCWIWFLQQCTTLCFKKMTNLRSAQSKTGLDVAKQRSHAKIYLFKRMYSNVRLLKLLFNLLGRQKKTFHSSTSKSDIFCISDKKRKNQKKWHPSDVTWKTRWYHFFLLNFCSNKNMYLPNHFWAGVPVQCMYVCMYLRSLKSNNFYNWESD